MLSYGLHHVAGQQVKDRMPVVKIGLILVVTTWSCSHSVWDSSGRCGCFVSDWLLLLSTAIDQIGATHQTAVYGGFSCHQMSSISFYCTAFPGLARLAATSDQDIGVVICNTGLGRDAYTTGAGLLLLVFPLSVCCQEFCSFS